MTGAKPVPPSINSQKMACILPRWLLGQHFAVNLTEVLVAQVQIPGEPSYNPVARAWVNRTCYVELDQQVVHNRAQG